MADHLRALQWGRENEVISRRNLWEKGQNLRRPRIHPREQSSGGAGSSDPKGPDT
jgi:hypothetical protein